MISTDSLARIALDLQLGISHQDRFHRLIQSVRSLLNSDASALLRYEGGQFIPLAIDGLMQDVLGRRFALKDHPRLEAIARAGDVVRFPADSALPDPYDGLLPDHDDFKVHACVGLPLFSDQALIGALTIDGMNPTQFDGISDEELRLVGALAAAALDNALLLERLARQSSEPLAPSTQNGPGQPEMIGRSPAMARLRHEIDVVASSELNVLILGETGVGKELIAKAVHGGSPRAHAPLVYLNCAALPESVAESELFGYAPGAFGNNTEGKRGVLELASGGTLMLDEIGDMSPHLQTKFLRVLQDGVFRRVGDEQEVRVNVRFICTTQKQLLDLVHEGKFREDLYYRLNVLSLNLPPLRERKADIMALAQQFVSRFASELQRPRPRFTRNMAEYLTAYRWPGNVRQLRNCLYRAMTLLEGDEIGPEHVDLPVAADAMPLIDEWFEGGLDEAVKRFESRLLERLYPAFPSTRQLAKRLGVSHTAIANKLREYGIGKK